ncbi:hypothetical protein ACFL6I_00015 [candidate division KSB1 bacterium]
MNTFSCKSTRWKKRVSAAAFISVCGIVLTVSCLNPFAPKIGEISSNINLILTEQKTPDDVLANFLYAYTLKDSLIYRDLLDEDFVFVYRDHENDRFVSWGKEADIRTTIGLFNTFNVINLVWNSTNYISYTADSSEVEMSKQFVLTLGTDIRLTGDALFLFRKLESGIWRIIRWVDKTTV